jgi:3,4-dihydroxy 2-butanone 4-phosphate synthase/GTP cyclohydrolase II
MALPERWLQETAASAPPGRPLVTLSYAQTLDGSIAARRGQPSAISGRESLQLTHRLRAAHDAILVGIGTVLSDDPQLTVRLIEGRSPQPIVLDSRLRLPLSARLLEHPRKPWLFATAAAEDAAQAALERLGARVERQSQPGRVDLDAMLARLAELGVASLMVEGGGEVITAFLAAGLVDRAMVTVSPVHLQGYTIRGALPLMKDVHSEDAGQDLVLFGRLEPQPA